MANSLNSFNLIAPVYDRLAGLAFGTAIQDAQKAHLDALSSAREILILGGGTGWLLKDLLQRNSSARVVYVEASQRMIDLATKSLLNADRHRVAFVHGTEETLLAEDRFDAVVINFFVDMFTTPELIKILQRLHLILRPGGQLLCTDFVDDGRWQKVVLSAMYTFFKVTAGLRNQRLPPWRELISDEGFERMRSQSFWNGFICSELYRKDFNEIA